MSRDRGPLRAFVAVLGLFAVGCAPFSVLVVGAGFLLASGLGDASSSDAPSAAGLLEAGRRDFDAQRFDDARASFVRAAEVAKAAGDASAEAEGLALAARTFVAAGRLDEARPWLDKAGKVADPAHPLGWSTYLAVRARLHWKAKALAEASRDLEALYAFCVQKALHERAVDAANLMVLVGTPAQKVEWARRGIDAAEKGGLDRWLGPLWNNLGLAHEDAGRHGDAADAYLRAREAHWKTGGEAEKLAADWAVGHALRLKGDHAEAATWLRPVLAWAERRLAARSTPENAEWVGLASKDLGQLEAAAGRTADALALLRRAKELLGAAKMADWDPKAWADLEASLARLEPPPPK